MHLVFMQSKKGDSGVQMKLSGMFLCLLDNFNLESFCKIFSYLWPNSERVVPIVVSYITVGENQGRMNEFTKRKLPEAR